MARPHIDLNVREQIIKHRRGAIDAPRLLGRAPKLIDGFELKYGYVNQNLFEYARNTVLFMIFRKKYFQAGDDIERKKNLVKVENSLRDLLQKLNLQDSLIQKQKGVLQLKKEFEKVKLTKFATELQRRREL